MPSKDFREIIEKKYVHTHGFPTFSSNLEIYSLLFHYIKRRYLDNLLECNDMLTSGRGRLVYGNSL
jgi:hypothetical protein